MARRMFSRGTPKRRALLGAAAISATLVAAALALPDPADGTPARQTAEAVGDPAPWLGANAVCRGGRKRTGAALFGISSARAAEPLSITPGARTPRPIPVETAPDGVTVSPVAATPPPLPAGETGDLPRLVDGLGPVTYPISTDHPLAQAYFDQGLRLTYGFHHAAAGDAFKAAERLDPRCAICAWGVALVLGPNINAPMDPRAVGPAFSAIARARALAGDADGKERALITALATRYSPDPTADRLALDRAYAEAMLTLARLYPNDDDILTLTAEAVMTTQPWDYWTPEKTPKGEADQAIALIETVLERNPDHVGAIHLFIHLMEAGPKPEAALPYARRMPPLVPAAGHLMHMPSHIYMRLGMHKDSLEVNVRAIEADEAFLAHYPDRDLVRYGYYPHNVHFVLTSAQLLGSRQIALDTGRKLSQLMQGAPNLDTALWTQAIVAAPWFAQAQFGDADGILLTPAPAERHPYLRAVWHHARALARLAKQDTNAARAEADAIAAIAVDPRLPELDALGFPASGLVGIAESVARGRIAWAELDFAAAAGHFEQAATMQDAIPYIEPPYWPYPVRQSLGAVLLEAGNYPEAEQAFRRALLEYPNNGWALYGLAQTYERMGKTAVADRTFRQFEKVWVGTQPPSLKAL